MTVYTRKRKKKKKTEQKKKNGYLENLVVFPKLIQSELVPVEIHGQSELDFVSF